MSATGADDLIPFQNVLVVRSTPPALLCRIGTKQVWLLRSQMTGKLWCTGDRGRLLLPRRVAVDHGLIGAAH
jgi:hypothetical protein